MEKSEYLKILLPTVFIVIVAISFYVISNSALGKALISLLGTAAGIAASMGKQFETCNKVGYFNINKGCYLGVFAVIGLVGPFLFRYLWKVTGSQTKNELVEETSQVSNKSQSDVIDESIPDSGKEITDKILDSNGNEIPLESKIAGWKKSFIKKLRKLFNKSVEEQSMNDEEKVQKIKDFEQRSEVEMESIDNERIDEAKSDDPDVDESEVQDQIDISEGVFDGAI